MPYSNMQQHGKNENPSWAEYRHDCMASHTKLINASHTHIDGNWISSTPRRCSTMGKPYLPAHRHRYKSTSKARERHRTES